MPGLRKPALRRTPSAPQPSTSSYTVRPSGAAISTTYKTADVVPTAPIRITATQGASHVPARPIKKKQQTVYVPGDGPKDTTQVAKLIAERPRREEVDRAHQQYGNLTQRVQYSTDTWAQLSDEEILKRMNNMSLLKLESKLGDRARAHRLFQQQLPQHKMDREEKIYTLNGGIAGNSRPTTASLREKASRGKRRELRSVADRLNNNNDNNSNRGHSHEESWGEEESKKQLPGLRRAHTRSLSHVQQYAGILGPDGQPTAVVKNAFQPASPPLRRGALNNHFKMPDTKYNRHHNRPNRDNSQWGREPPDSRGGRYYGSREFKGERAAVSARQRRRCVRMDSSVRTGTHRTSGSSAHADHKWHHVYRGAPLGAQGLYNHTHHMASHTNITGGPSINVARHLAKSMSHNNLMSRQRNLQVSTALGGHDGSVGSASRPSSPSNTGSRPESPAPRQDAAGAAGGGFGSFI